VDLAYLLYHGLCATYRSPLAPILQEEASVLHQNISDVHNQSCVSKTDEHRKRRTSCRFHPQILLPFPR
jgi:hypothetical protein